MKLDGHFLSTHVVFVPEVFYTQLAMMTGVMPMLWTYERLSGCAKAVERFEGGNVLDLPPTWRIIRGFVSG